MSNKKILRLVVCGMLIAADVVLKGLLSVKQWNIEFSFAFLAVAAAAYLYGPIGGALVHGLTDVICAFVFPKGEFFPGFTLTAALIGAIYGLCFHNSRKVWRTSLGVVLAQVCCSLFLNTLWISVLYHTSFWVFLASRLIQVAVMGTIQVIVLPAFLLALERGVKPFLNGQR